VCRSRPPATQPGSAGGRACNAPAACSGFGTVVDTAAMTACKSARGIRLAGQYGLARTRDGVVPALNPAGCALALGAPADLVPPGRARCVGGRRVFGHVDDAQARARARIAGVLGRHRRIDAGNPCAAAGRDAAGDPVERTERALGRFLRARGLDRAEVGEAKAKGRMRDRRLRGCVRRHCTRGSGNDSKWALRYTLPCESGEKD
jgi:hypothetical protein